MIRQLFLAAAALAFGAAGPACAATLEAPGHVAGELDRIKLSPDGDRIAAVVPAERGARLVVRDASGRKLASFETGPTALRRIAWAGDDRLLFEVAALVDSDDMFAASGREYSQLFVGDLRTGKVSALLHNKLQVAPIAAGDFGVFSSKGRWRVAVGGVTLEGAGEMEKDFNMKTFALTHPWPDLYVVDLDRDQPEKIAPGREVFQGWVVASSGAALARLQRERRGGDLALYSVRGGRGPLWRGPAAGRVDIEAAEGEGAGPIVIAATGAPLEAVDPAGSGPARALFDGAPLQRLLRGPDDRPIGAEVQTPDGKTAERFFDAAVETAFAKAKQIAGAPSARFVSVDSARRRWVLAVTAHDYRLVDVGAGVAAPFAPAS